MKTKASQAELEYLFRKVIEKYNHEHIRKISGNTNKKTYEPLVKLLNDISIKFPETEMELKHEDYFAFTPGNLSFSAGQFMNAKLHFTQKPDQVIVDACYIYLFRVGQKGFRENPSDPKLAEIIKTNPSTSSPFHGIPDNNLSKRIKVIGYSLVIVLLIGLLAFKQYQLQCARSSATSLGTRFEREKKKWKTIKKDYSIMRYQPTRTEIDSLVGVWACYTGSPQTRRSITNRYHLGARNIVDIKYSTDGYFTFTRYSTNFDQTGYIQYESPGLISIHSHKVNLSDSTLWPRHSLMFVNDGKPFHIAISAAWTFDTPPNEFIIGIREVYIKLGSGGKVTEIVNDGKSFKRVQWITDKNKRTVYSISFVRIEQMNVSFNDLLNEKSILQAIPQENLLQTKLIH